VTGKAAARRRCFGRRRPGLHENGSTRWRRRARGGKRCRKNKGRRRRAQPPTQTTRFTQQQLMPPRHEPIPPPQSASVLQGYPQLQRQVRPPWPRFQSGSITEAGSALHDPPSIGSKLGASADVGAGAHWTWPDPWTPGDDGGAVFSPDAIPPETGRFSAISINAKTVATPNAVANCLPRIIGPSSLMKGGRDTLRLHPRPIRT
jgi:hypothetical protein